VSDDHTSVQILMPQKEFNFGNKNQIYSDCPQIRVRDEKVGVYQKLCLYRSLKSEEFVVIGSFKQIENSKEIEVPEPEERVIEVSQPLVVSEPEEKLKPFMLEKPGFPPLKPIIPVS
jgi:hypothetical protein